MIVYTMAVADDDDDAFDTACDVNAYLTVEALMTAINETIASHEEIVEHSLKRPTSLDEFNDVFKSSDRRVISWYLGEGTGASIVVKTHNL